MARGTSGREETGAKQKPGGPDLACTDMYLEATTTDTLLEAGSGRDGLVHFLLL